MPGSVYCDIRILLIPGLPKVSLHKRQTDCCLNVFFGRSSVRLSVDLAIFCSVYGVTSAEKLAVNYIFSSEIRMNEYR